MCRVEAPDGESKEPGARAVHLVRGVDHQHDLTCGAECPQHGQYGEAQRDGIGALRRCLLPAQCLAQGRELGLRQDEEPVVGDLTEEVGECRMVQLALGILRSGEQHQVAVFAAPPGE